jgi:hypothetical protein
MADDMQLGRDWSTGQGRNTLGRWAAIPRGHAGYKYCPEERQLYKLVRPDEVIRIRSGTRMRLDRGQIYVQCKHDRPEVEMTPRAFWLGIAAVADAGLAYWAAWALDVHAHTHPLAIDRISTAVMFYFVLFGWFGCARALIHLWPPPNTDDTFESLDQIAARKQWKKPRNARFDDIDTREQGDD